MPGDRPVGTDDPTEQALLTGVRADPADAATRAVYADWLEAHGHAARAAVLHAEAAEPRDEHRLRAVAEPADAAWRAVVSRAPIDRCTFELAFQCPRRWDALAPTGDDATRFCATCEREVYFCASVDEARQRGLAGDCIAIDAAVARGEALDGYDRARAPVPVPEHQIKMGMYLPPPPPLPPPRPRKPGVLARIKRLFGR